MQGKQVRSRKGMQAATNINTPRSIRSRLSFPRRKAAPDSAAVPEAPQQQVVRSASGRTAMGPWIGSFGSAEEPTSPTLFASSQGRVFSDLSGGAVASEDLVSNPEVAGAAHAVAVVHPPQPPLAEMKRQARMMRTKAEAGRSTYRAPRASNLMRRQRRIFQARKHN